MYCGVQKKKSHEFRLTRIWIASFFEFIFLTNRKMTDRSLAAFDAYVGMRELGQIHEVNMFCMRNAISETKMLESMWVLAFFERCTWRCHWKGSFAK
jgi:hypothetical protein